MMVFKNFSGKPLGFKGIFIFVSILILLDAFFLQQAIAMGINGVQIFYEGRITIVGFRALLEFLLLNFVRPLMMAAMLVVGMGFIYLKKWARMGLMVMSILYVIDIFLLIFSRRTLSLGLISSASIIFILPCVLVIRYLSKEKIRVLFC